MIQIAAIVLVAIVIGVGYFVYQHIRKIYAQQADLHQRLQLIETLVQTQMQFQSSDSPVAESTSQSTGKAPENSKSEESTEKSAVVTAAAKEKSS